MESTCVEGGALPLQTWTISSAMAARGREWVKISPNPFSFPESKSSYVHEIKQGSATGGVESWRWLSFLLSLTIKSFKNKIILKRQQQKGTSQSESYTTLYMKLPVYYSPVGIFIHKCICFVNQYRLEYVASICFIRKIIYSVSIKAPLIEVHKTFQHRFSRIATLNTLLLYHASSPVSPTLKES